MKSAAITVILIFLGGCTKTETSSPVKEAVLEINGTRIYTKIIGEGEPIIFVHGGPGLDHSYFLPHVENFAKDYQLIFFDQRLGGRSSFEDIDSTEITLAHFVDDIEGVRGALNLEKVHLLGHSFGGIFAMKYALKYPENLKSLLLTSSTAASQEYVATVNQLMNERLTDELRQARTDLMSTNAFKSAEPATMANLSRITFTPNFFHQHLADSLNIYIPKHFAVRQAKLSYLMPEVANMNFYEDLVNVKCPTLVLRGKNEILPLEATTRIHEKIPNSKLTVLENCGHFPFLDCKSDFDAELTSFLNSLPK